MLHIMLASLDQRALFYAICHVQILVYTAYRFTSLIRFIAKSNSFLGVTSVFLTKTCNITMVLLDIVQKNPLAIPACPLARISKRPLPIALVKGMPKLGPSSSIVSMIVKYFALILFQGYLPRSQRIDYNK